MRSYFIFFPQSHKISCSVNSNGFSKDLAGISHKIGSPLSSSWMLKRCWNGIPYVLHCNAVAFTFSLCTGYLVYLITSENCVLS